MKGHKFSKLKFHPMKLTFLFLVLIIGIWLASTTFGTLFEGMKGGKDKATAAKKVVVKPVNTKKAKKQEDKYTKQMQKAMMKESAAMSSPSYMEASKK